MQAEKKVIVLSAGYGKRLEQGDIWPKCCTPISGESACLKQIRYWLEQGVAEENISFVVRIKHRKLLKSFCELNGYNKVRVLAVQEHTNSAKAIAIAISSLKLIGHACAIQWADIILQSNWPWQDGNFVVSQNEYNNRYATDSQLGAKLVGGTAGDLLGAFNFANLANFSWQGADDFADCLPQLANSYKVQRSIEFCDFGSLPQLAEANKRFSYVYSTKKSALTYTDKCVIKLGPNEANCFKTWQSTGFTNHLFANELKTAAHPNGELYLMHKANGPTLFQANLPLEQKFCIMQDLANSLNKPYATSSASLQCISAETVDKLEARLPDCLLQIADYFGQHSLADLADFAKSLYWPVYWQNIVLGHFDIHMHNVLSHNNKWCLIDPRPICNQPYGPQSYELAKLLFAFGAWPYCYEGRPIELYAISDLGDAFYELYLQSDVRAFSMLHSLCSIKLMAHDISRLHQFMQWAISESTQTMLLLQGLN